MAFTRVHFRSRQRWLIPNVVGGQRMRGQEDFGKRDRHARNVTSALDSVQAFFDGIVDIDHFDRRQTVPLVQRPFPLQDLGNRHGLVDGAAHGFQHNGAVQIVLC